MLGRLLGSRINRTVVPIKSCGCAAPPKKHCNFKRFLSIKKHPHHPQPIDVSTAHRLHNLLRKQSLRNKVLLGAFTGLVTGTGCYLYLFKEEVQGAVADTVSQVATKSLGDGELRTSAALHTKQLITDLLNDGDVQRQAENFVKRVIEQESTREATKSLLISVVESEHFYNIVAEKLKNITVDILQADYTREIVKSQLHSIFACESTQKVVENLFQNVLEQDQVKEFSSRFVEEVVSSQQVVDRASNLATDITSQLLSDEDIKKQAGDALWSAFKYSVVPKKIPYFSSKPQDDLSQRDVGEIPRDEKVFETEFDNHSLALV